MYDGTECIKRIREKKTGVLAALFLFQYSLLIPLMSFIRPTFLVAASGLLLMVATVIVNRSIKINSKSCLVIVVLVLIMFLKSFIDGTDVKVILSFLLICIPPTFIYSYAFDTKQFLKTCYRLSYLNFLLLFYMPFAGGQGVYMRFGNGMVLTSIFMYLLIFRGRKQSIEDDPYRQSIVIRILNIVVFVVSTLEITIYGNRGALVILLSFVAIDVFLIYRKRVIRNFIIILAGFIALLNLENILNILMSISSRFGVFSYALRKYEIQLEFGLVGASSGRAKLYGIAINEIKENPILGSKMIIYTEDTAYVHNLFLQVGRDLGVVAILVLLFFVIYCLYLLFTKKMDLNAKTIIAVFFTISVVRLLLSSILWERPEFWALICLVLNCRKSLCCSPKLLIKGDSRR